VGGTEYVQMFKVANLAQSMEILKELEFRICGLDESGERSLFCTDFGSKTVVVIGAEGQGLRSRTIKLCDVLVRIPGGRIGVESLNAGVAASIAMGEVARQNVMERLGDRGISID